jgi:hypothetical protein
MTADNRSGITSDPTARTFVGQVVRISLETMKIVNGLPAEREPA